MDEHEQGLAPTRQKTIDPKPAVRWIGDQSPFDEIVEVSTPWGGFRSGAFVAVVVATMACFVGLSHYGASTAAYVVVALTGCTFAFTTRWKVHADRKKSAPKPRVLAKGGREPPSSPRTERVA